MHILRFAFTMLSFVGTFIGVFIVMISALLNLNKAEPIDSAGNTVLIICAVLASFSISISIIGNINNFMSEK